ncbi:MAG: hypothetical protein V3W20_13505 [Candidatus Neomarinimicrobiota bacterium]
MSKKKTERQRLRQIIVGCLRETIRIHGPITKLLVGSAAKRITGTIITKDKINEQ